MTAGVTSLYAALDEPVEGTILTVMRETAEVAEKGGRSRFRPLYRSAARDRPRFVGQDPATTPRAREGWLSWTRAQRIRPLARGRRSVHQRRSIVAAGDEVDFSDLPPAVADFEYPEEDERYRYCTEALVRGESMPTSEAGPDRASAARGFPYRDRLRGPTQGPPPHGRSRRRLHVPEGPRAARHAQGGGHAGPYEAAGRASGHTRLIRRPITILTDSANDLPEEIIRAHGIHGSHWSSWMATASCATVWTSPPRNSTNACATARPVSCPRPPSLRRRLFWTAFNAPPRTGSKSWGVLLGSGLSGTFASGEAAALRSEGTPVHLCDSLGASLLQGLLVLKAAELGEAGMPPGESSRSWSECAPNPAYSSPSIRRSPAAFRQSREGRAWLGTVLSVKPILGLDEKGKVVPKGRPWDARVCYPP